MLPTPSRPQAMAERTSDNGERLTVRSTLAAFAVALVDHRVLFQLAVVCLALFALRTWGPEDISRGIDYVAGAGAGPVRIAGRVVTGMWRIAVDGLEGADRAVRRTGIVPDRIPDSPGSTLGERVRAAAPPIDGAPPPRVVPSAKSPGSQSTSHVALPRIDTKTVEEAVADAAGTSGSTSSPDGIVWTLVKDQEIIRAELRDEGKAGADLLLFRNGRLWRRERWADRAAARVGADEKRADLERNGWAMLNAHRSGVQSADMSPSPGRGGAPPGWKRVVKLSDGRTFITDGALSLDAAVAKPRVLPGEALGASSAKVLEGFLSAALPQEVDLTGLRPASAGVNYVAPNGVLLNAGYIDYLRAALPRSRVRLRMKGDLEPVVILLDGNPVGLVMPMRRTE